MRRRNWLLLFSLLVQVRYLPAQHGQFQFSRLDIDQGLSHNLVSAIFKDSKGFLWFGTMAGLNRYDGYKFKVFRHDLRDSTSISDDFVSQILEGPGDKLWASSRSGFCIYNPVTEKFDRNPQFFLHSININDANILDIKKDRQGNFWFVDARKGLYKYITAANETVHFSHKENDAATLHSDSVTSIAHDDASGGWWIIYNDGMIDEMDTRTDKIMFRTDKFKKSVFGGSKNYNLYADGQNILWIYNSGGAAGIFYFNAFTGEIKHFYKDGSAASLNTDLVNGVVQDNDGLIWIATDHGGINLLDKNNFSIRYLRNREDDDKSISQNSINAIYKDNAGIIWIGTFKKGISYYHNGIIKFPLYRRQLSNPESLSYNDVNRFLEDANGNLWIGTNGGGLIYFNRQTGTFKQYLHKPLDRGSLCNDVIVSLCLDHEHKLWIGTYFGGLDCFDGKIFKHYCYNETDSNSISDNRIWEIMEDSQQRLWIGTLAAGLDLFDRKKNKFIHYKPGFPNSVQSGYISELVEDKQGNLWIGTANGIDVLEKKSARFIHYGHDDNNIATSLSNNNIISIIEDSRGMIWIGTREGLNVFNPSTKKFKTFRKEDGLPDNTVLTIIEDNEHNLWLGTPNGLSNVIVSKNIKTDELLYQFKNYDENDGLQGREFNENAALKTKTGELIFGGANGFNIFNPHNIKTEAQLPAVVITSLEVFNKEVAIGEKLNGNVILHESITTVKKITLRYNQNVFSIEFAALGLPVNKKVKYAYLLEGFNKQWLLADEKSRKATFTNLDAGNYVFIVKTALDNGTWSNENRLLSISILPPFWKTPVAYVIYTFVALGILFFARKMILQRARMRFAIEHERREAQRLHELDMMKIRFFTNVSHEFRTPLSLILSPLDKIIKNTGEPSQKNQFQLIHRNARRLLNLVNQLLDFRKMEVRELKLHPSPGDLAKFIKDTFLSFTDLAEKKNIHFSYVSPDESFFTEFDHDKIERILFNLLSNAFKFTPENGEVSMEMIIENSNDDDFIASIEIKDTGIGIAPEKQEKIFERFFQNELTGSMVSQGSGIGLTITKEFVKLHGGTISVKSEVNKGSLFTLALPFKKMVNDSRSALLYSGEVQAAAPENILEEEAMIVSPQGSNGIQKNKKPKVLLVEDNEDFRFYLKDNLREYFNIIEASDGKEGWQRALATHPDLVVSDITMPLMNGIDLCKKIKTDKRTSFMPVILLTALTGEDQQLKGLETGANDYMAKPFNFEILLSKIKNLLGQQEQAKKTYQKQVQASPSDISVGSTDEKFMQHALELVEKNISNDEFSVEEMSRGLFISRVALYKKLLSLTGKTPVEFIRSMRMKRAAQLLEKSNLTVSEIAYEVGFNNPKYFSRYFKTEFGMLPSAYHAEKKKETDNKANALQK